MTIEQLNNIKNIVISDSTTRLTGSKDYKEVLVCGGTGCLSNKSLEVYDSLKLAVKNAGLDNIKILKVGCFGFCKEGPIVVVYPEQTFYCEVGADTAERIADEHLKNGKIVEDCLFKDIKSEQKTEKMSDVTFFHNQCRNALRNCGLISAESIDEYIAQDGYFALHKALREQTPQMVIETVKASKIRGRGGAGFPTGTKWELAAQAVKRQAEKPSPEDTNNYGQHTESPAFVICNADEGDPGAFMDRSILEGDPHSILEAMTIAGYAIGANKGYIYVRAEYPVAIERLRIAIKQAEFYGLLGENIFGSGFSFNIDLKYGAGAFVCGEETALINSASGRRGEPRPRPPYPAEEGIWDKPTVVNNVETLANIPPIILNNAESFISTGTESSAGTKVFALAGQINNTGLIEVPMGTSLKTIVYDIGGGIPDGNEFKAVQTGGPSGGCIPARHMETPIDYESLAGIGSMMGSGGMIVLSDKDCMVDIAKFYLEFSQDESCGKCTPCRIGTKRMLELLTKITEGEELDISTLQHDNDESTDKADVIMKELLSLAEDIKDGSLCGLGQTAPNPVISTLKYFADEYIEHINSKHCRSGVCAKLTKYKIIPEKCIACGICAKICPVSAIKGKIKDPPYIISPEICIACGACEPKCPTKAIFH